MNGNGRSEAFGAWLTNAMREGKVSDTKLAASMGVTAPAVIKWRSGVVPRNPGVVEAIADYFGEDQNHVLMLAGRGRMGMESNLTPEAVKWANDIQSILDSVDDPEVAEIAFNMLSQSVGMVKDAIERLKDMRATLTQKK